MIDSASTPHRRYLTWAAYTVGLAGQDVLEIGGCSPVAEIRQFSPKSWTCYNLDGPGVEAFNADAARYGCANFAAHARDAATIELASRFSVAYSINAFEHISDLRTALAQVRRGLAPAGLLFTVFGPIWSADVGHHLSIPTDKGPIGMFDGVLERWEHLTSTPAQIFARIQPRWGTEISQRVIDYVFTYPDLNRLSESDYENILRGSQLSPLLVLRRKAKGPAPVAPASRTRELMWILKKGPASPWEKARTAMRFALAFTKTRISAG